MIRLPSTPKPEVSVIVLLDGAPELAVKCLRALAGDSDSVPYEVVLLLNDPDPALEGLVRKSTTGGKVVVSRANAGPGVGWHLGAEVAVAPRLATLHEDSEPEAGWLVPLVDAMKETGAGAVGARLYNHDGSVQNCGWALFSNGMPQPLHATSAPDIVAATEPTAADVLSGAAMLVDRAAVEAIGGWDERFHPAVYADIDISIAMWNQGRLVLSVPTSGVRHRSGTFGRRPNSVLTGPRLRDFLIERNSQLFLAKWGAVVSGLAPPPIDRDPARIKAAVDLSLDRTRARAKAIRSGDWSAPPSSPSPDRPYSTLIAPLLNRDDDAYVVVSEVQEALKAGEQGLINEYCGWLVSREAELFDRLLSAGDELEVHHRLLADLRSELEKVTAHLDAILDGRTWRLRTTVLNALQRLRRAARRLAGGRRSDPR